MAAPASALEEFKLQSYKLSLSKFLKICKEKKLSKIRPFKVEVPCGLSLSVDGMPTELSKGETFTISKIAFENEKSSIEIQVKNELLVIDTSETFLDELNYADFIFQNLKGFTCAVADTHEGDYETNRELSLDRGDQVRVQDIPLTRNASTNFQVAPKPMWSVKLIDGGLGGFFPGKFLDLDTIIEDTIVLAASASSAAAAAPVKPSTPAVAAASVAAVSAPTAPASVPVSTTVVSKQAVASAAAPASAAAAPVLKTTNEIQEIFRAYNEEVTSALQRTLFVIKLPIVDKKEAVETKEQKEKREIEERKRMKLLTSLDSECKEEKKSYKILGDDAEDFCIIPFENTADDVLKIWNIVANLSFPRKDTLAFFFAFRKANGEYSKIEGSITSRAIFDNNIYLGEIKEEPFKRDFFISTIVSEVATGGLIQHVEPNLEAGPSAAAAAIPAKPLEDNAGGQTVVASSAPAAAVSATGAAAVTTQSIAATQPTVAKPQPPVTAASPVVAAAAAAGMFPLPTTSLADNNKKLIGELSQLMKNTVYGAEPQVISNVLLYEIAEQLQKVQNTPNLLDLTRAFRLYVTDYILKFRTYIESEIRSKIDDKVFLNPPGNLLQHYDYCFDEFINGLDYFCNKVMTLCIELNLKDDLTELINRKTCDMPDGLIWYILPLIKRGSLYNTSSQDFSDGACSKFSDDTFKANSMKFSDFCRKLKNFSPAVYDGAAATTAPVNNEAIIAEIGKFNNDNDIDDTLLDEISAQIDRLNPNSKAFAELQDAVEKFILSHIKCKYEYAKTQRDRYICRNRAPGEALDDALLKRCCTDYLDKLFDIDKKIEKISSKLGLSLKLHNKIFKEAVNFKDYILDMIKRHKGACYASATEEMDKLIEKFKPSEIVCAVAKP